MRRDQLEHILRAASRVTREPQLLVVGSQAILGTFPEDALPAAAIRSIEADIAAFDDPGDHKADQIDGAIGEGSRFHAEFGVYAQGVSVRTAVLPGGWETRLVRLKTANTEPGAGLCLEPHDLLLSKLVRGETRDYVFATAVARAGLVERSVLAARIADLHIDDRVKDRIRGWLQGTAAQPRTAAANAAATAPAARDDDS